jgi:signal transduction histidine kinase
MKIASSTSLERFVLGLGLLSSLCLGVAALAAFGGGRDAGWSRVDDLANRARANVRETWDDLRRVDAQGETGLRALCDPVVLDGEILADGPAPVRLRPMSSPNLFEVLLAQAEACELHKQDLEQALSLVSEALQKQAPPEQLGLARLRAIQLAQRLDRADEVLGHWHAAREGIDPAFALGDTSTLLLCALAALPAIPEQARAAELDQLVRLWTANELVLPASQRGYAPTDASDSPRQRWFADARESALRQRLGDSANLPEAWRAQFSEFDERAQRQDFLALIEQVPSGDFSRDLWTVAPVNAELIAVRLDEQARRIGQLLSRSETESALNSALNSRHALPEDFALDLSGNAAQLGETVGPWLDLGPAFPRVTLRHPDLAGVLREAEARTQWLRIGMWTLALFVAGAALATYFALRRQRRLAQARTSFIANVSHELRTPLASILLMSENLESGRAGKNADAYPKLLRRESLRLRRLIDDVLDFSRLERGKRFEARIEDVDVPAWFAATCADASALAAQQGCELRCDSATLPARAAFDAEALRRAILNLVDNALRHSGSKEISLSARGEGEQALVLSICDRGHGIPAAQRRAIFEPFVRLNGATLAAGAGLGLAIVREIAAAHSGSVRVLETPEHQGSTFELSIPVADSATMANMVPR